MAERPVRATTWKVVRDTSAAMIFAQADSSDLGLAVDDVEPAGKRTPSLALTGASSRRTASCKQRDHAHRVGDLAALEHPPGLAPTRTAGPRAARSPRDHRHHESSSVARKR